MRVDTLAKTIAADMVAERRAAGVAQSFAECMTCGRSLDAEKAAREGGRRRFCSDRCMTYFDAGWQPNRGPSWMLPASGSAPASCIPKSASGRGISAAAKHRERVKRKKAFANSWKKYLTKQRGQLTESRD